MSEVSLSEVQNVDTKGNRMENRLSKSKKRNSQIVVNPRDTKPCENLTVGFKGDFGGCFGVQ
jgi:hypothetical protein